MTLTPEQLTKNAQIWDEQIESLARYLCEVKGEDADKWWTDYKGDAEQYLRRRALNHHYWYNIASVPFDSNDQP